MKDYSGFLKEMKAVLPAERVYTDELRTLAARRSRVKA